MRRSFMTAIVLAGFAIGGATAAPTPGPVAGDPLSPAAGSSRDFQAAPFFDVLSDIRPDSFGGTIRLFQQEPSPVSPISASVEWLEPQSAINYEMYLGAGVFTRFATQAFASEHVNAGIFTPGPPADPAGGAAKAFILNVQDSSEDTGDPDGYLEPWDPNPTPPTLDVPKRMDVVLIDLPDPKTVALIAVGLIGLRWLWKRLVARRQGI